VAISDPATAHLTAHKKPFLLMGIPTWNVKLIVPLLNIRGKTAIYWVTFHNWYKMICTTGKKNMLHIIKMEERASLFWIFFVFHKFSLDTCRRW
jgi:hypothetical protein